MKRDAALAAAEIALDEGRGDLALKALRRLAADDTERALLAIQAHLLENDFGAAEDELARTAARLAPDDPGLLWARSELHLRGWQHAAARKDLERLVAKEPSAAALDRLSLCLELAGDLAGADRALARAAKLDPAGAPVPPRLDDAAFDEVVEAAIAELPDVHRAALDRARVVTEPMPFEDLVDPGDPSETPPDLLGLFVGATLHDLAEDLPAELPPTIYLFQRNLERSCRDADDLREQIRITLFHELGHLLGLDEDEVDAMGLG